MKRKIKLFVILTMLLVGLAGLASCQTDTTDTTKPVFKDAINDVLPEKTILVKTATTEADLLSDVTATDDVDGEVAVVVNLGSFDYNKVGQYTLTYTAVDKAGNVATATRKINVVDTVSPRFEYENTQTGKLPAVESLQFVELDLLNLEYLSVIDNYDTNLKPTVKDDDGFNYEVVGTYTVTYSVKDSSGNETTIMRDITILPAIKYVEDVLKINGEAHAAQWNNEKAMVDNNDGYGMGLRRINAVQIMTKEFYLSQLETLYSNYSSNANHPFLPYGVAVVLDSEYRPVLVRNAAYAIEAVLNTETGSWDLHKGQDLTFVDSTTPNATTPSGILGGNFESYIPDGGFVLMAGSPFGGNLDTCKIFLIKNLLSDTFTGGALSWESVEGVAQELLVNAKFEYVKDYTTIYPAPDALETPEIKIEKHVLSWQAITGAKEYQIFVDGEFLMATTNTYIKMIDLGLEPSNEGEFYKIAVKAITSDIRDYSDSALSEELEYAMPDSEELPAPSIKLEDDILSWDEIPGATAYEIYATQLGNQVLVATVKANTCNLKDIEELKKLIANAYITVKAIGDGIEFLDSEASNKVEYFCGSEQVIVINGERQPVIVTNVADYFARRNDSTAVGYAEKTWLYLITDADQLKEGLVEAYSFLVLFDKYGNVKAIINVLNTTKQYYNYEWVSASSFGYATNGSQIAPLLGILEEGDQLLIGRTGGSFTINETMTGKQGRDVLANHFYGKFVEGSSESWRSEHTVEDFPKFEIKPANVAQLEAPVLTINGTVIQWEAVEGATSYELYIDGNLVETLNVTNYDLAKSLKTVGKTGAQGVNYSDISVAVVAKADDKEDSEKITHKYRVSSQLSDGTNNLDVNYNVESVLWNGGSGANCRLTDNVSSLLVGLSYKSAVQTYVKSSSTYDNNAKNAFMQNGIIVVLDRNLQVKQIRFGFVTALQIDKEYNITTPTTWNNETVNSTKGGGNFLNLENEVEDDDYVIIVTNAGDKKQLAAACKMFVNTDSNAVLVTRKAITDPSLVETRVDLSSAQYEIVLNLVEITE